MVSPFIPLVSLASKQLINQFYSILCSDFAIKRIDEPFITRDDNLDEWAL